MKIIFCNIFIGALLAMGIYDSDFLGVAFFLVLALFFTRNVPLLPIKKKRLPNQDKIFADIARIKIESYSPETIGMLNGNPIHNWIRVYNSNGNGYTLYEFSDIIRYNEQGNIDRVPMHDEVYISQGMIYKIPAKITE